jgi:hypothetical protein
MKYAYNPNKVYKWNVLITCPKQFLCHEDSVISRIEFLQ